MKNLKFLISILLFFILLLCGCSNNIKLTQSELPSIENELSNLNVEDTTAVKSHSCEDEGCVVDEIKGYDSYKANIINEIDFGEYEINSIITSQVEKGRLSANNEATVMLFEVKSDYRCSLPHIPILVINNNGKLIYQNIGGATETVYGSNFSLCDIDGDGCDEIIVQTGWWSSGPGAGNGSTIYKFENNKLNLIFEHYYDNPDSSSYFDTGFRVELSDGYFVTVKNIYSGFKTTFIKKDWGNVPGDWNYYFNKTGNVTSNGKEFNDGKTDMIFGSFSEFKPVDIDGDGIYEILTEQYAEFWYKGDSIGYFYTILKWDKNKQKLTPIKADLNDYNDVDYENEETPNYYWNVKEQYINNWYKK